MWEVYQGDALPLNLTMLDSDENPVDLTGYTFSIEVSWDNKLCCNDASSALFDTDSQGRNTITLSPTVTAAAGTVVSSLTGAQTKELPEGKKAEVKVKWTDADGLDFTRALGRIRVRT